MRGDRQQALRKERERARAADAADEAWRADPRSESYEKLGSFELQPFLRWARGKRLRSLVKDVGGETYVPCWLACLWSARHTFEKEWATFVGRPPPHQGSDGPAKYALRRLAARAARDRDLPAIIYTTLSVDGPRGLVAIAHAMTKHPRPEDLEEIDADSR